MQKMNYITAEQARTRTLQAMQKDEKRRKNIEKANRIIQRRITSAIEAKREQQHEYSRYISPSPRERQR